MKAIHGVGVALATPMHSDYSIDFDSLENLVNHVIDGGVDYLVVQGTTGESPVFSWEEKLEILDFVIEKSAGRKPVVFGLGGANTFDLIEKSKYLKRYDLAAILSASPYYNKPSQQGIIRHYQLLADAFPHPIILYNVPSRTASNMTAETTLELAKHDNIIAMKEASSDLQQCQKILNGRPKDFVFLSGEDGFTFTLLENGADGVISVIANLMTKEFTDMTHAGLQGNTDEAKKLDDHLQTGYKLATKEGNPSSIKAGLEAQGIGKRTVKPPLFDASDALVEEWKKYLG